MGRAAIQAAKQVLVQRVREAERENVFSEYADKTNQVVSGTVSQVDRGERHRQDRSDRGHHSAPGSHQSGSVQDR
ncbi:MAG: hypothetical protein R3E12_08410 [Candidatus Eisenbacteria bacterium]